MTNKIDRSKHVLDCVCKKLKQNNNKQKVIIENIEKE